MKKLTEVPVSAAEQQDPALHMEMETRRQERVELQGQEEAHTERERQIAQCHEIIGRIQGVKMIADFANVGGLLWIKQVRENKLYKDLPEVGTWEKFCKYIGSSRQKVEEDLENMAVFGEKFTTTVGAFGVGYRELRQLRQLTYDGESFQISDDGNTVVIEGETIILGDADAAPELEAALEKLLTRNKDLRDRNKKLEKDFKGALKEETAGLESEKKALLERVKALEIYEPDEKDREWSVKQMQAIEEAAGTFQLSVTRFVIDPRVNDDRHLQALLNQHLQQSEMALHDLRVRLDEIINMFND